MVDRTGQQFGSYRLLRRLGGGGFAEVYLGQHIRISTQQAAIKILQLTDVDEQQFQQEAERTAALKHAHIIRLYDFDIQQGIPFLVLEYAPQGSLAQYHEQRLSPDTVRSYITQIAPALQYAHDNEVIHRDIKPDNILVSSQGELLISDFGIAVISKTGRTTVQGTYNTGGTPYYMAPEMFRGRPEKASDQYSLGIMVYEWLCGRRPFTEGDFIQLGYQHAHEPVPSMRDLVPTIPQAIEEVVNKALAKDPLQRYKNVTVFATALEQAIMLPKTEVTPPIPHVQERASKQPPIAVSSTFETREKAIKLPPPIVAPSTSQTQEKVNNQPPVVVPSTSQAQERIRPFPPKAPVSPKPIEQPQSDKRTISRRTALIGLGITGLVVVGGSITWLTLSQKPTQGTTPRITATTGITPTPRTTSSALYTYTGHSDVVTAVAWSPDGKRIVSGGYDSTVKVWNATTGQTNITYTDYFDPVYAVAWSPDSKYIAVGGYGIANAVNVWNAATGKTSITYTGHSNPVYAVAWSLDSKLIASGSSDNTVKVWDASNGQTNITYKGHSEVVYAVAWSPDGKHIASGSGDQTVKVWDASSGQTSITYKGHSDAVNAVAWSPNGKYIASGSNDNTVKVWDTSTGQTSVTYTGHSGAVSAIAWSPDDTYIASGSVDHTVKIWDTSTGQTSVTYTGHSGAVYTVAWSPASKHIASGGYDHTVKVWNAF